MSESILHHCLKNYVDENVDNHEVFIENYFADIQNETGIIKKAFENQINGTGFSLVEVLSTCPTNWGITPTDSLKWLEENMIPYYPLGNKKEAK